MKNASKWFPGVADVNDGFFYNYWNAAWALVQGLNKSGGAVGAPLQAALPRTLQAGRSRSPTRAFSGSTAVARRSRISIRSRS